MSENNRKDFWDKAQVAGPFFLGIVGLIFTYILGTEQEKNRQAQQEIQNRVQLAQSERDFKGKMFPLMLDKLQDTNTHVIDRLIFLSFFKENFPNVFASYGASFIPLLLKEAENLNDTQERQKVLRELSIVARSIATEQVEQLKQKNIYYLFMEEGKTEEIIIDSKDRDGRKKKLVIALKKVRESDVIISLDIPLEMNYVEFVLTYFDTPLRNYTSFSDGQRIALLLDATYLESHEAEIRVIIF